eukprot:1161339-Pelagomonas_calceolata.AAC.9
MSPPILVYYKLPITVLAPVFKHWHMLGGSKIECTDPCPVPQRQALQQLHPSGTSRPLVCWGPACGRCTKIYPCTQVEVRASKFCASSYVGSANKGNQGMGGFGIQQKVQEAVQDCAAFVCGSDKDQNIGLSKEALSVMGSGACNASVRK